MFGGHRLQQAQFYIQSGQRQHAANLLTVYLASDPDNADAWWLLAEAATDPQTVRHALNNVLRLVPNDPRARLMLDSMDVRRSMAETKRDSQPMRIVSPTATAEYALPRPAVAPALPALEERHPARRRRGGRDIEPVLPRVKFPGFAAALLAVGLFGVAGCALLVYAALNGIQLVEHAFSEFTPPAISLPLPAILAGSGAAIPQLGDINMQGNLGYYQWRDGALTNPADVHAYTFTGSAGDFVLVEAVSTDGVLNPSLAVYGADRALIGSNADAAPDNMNARVSLVLPAAGEYTIVVSAQQSQGSYQLSLRKN